jgi:hypothetical protein
MTLEHLAVDPSSAGEGSADRLDTSPEPVFAEGRVVVVWIGPNRAPMRIPPEVREAFGISAVPS